MPFDTLAAAGFETHGGLLPHKSNHPYPTRAMQESAPPTPSSETVPPAYPGDPQPAAPCISDYLSHATHDWIPGPHLADVHVGYSVWLHPAWADTPLAAALRPPDPDCDASACDPSQPPPLLLDLNAMTPDMLEAMAPPTRRSLLTILGSVENLPVRWRDLAKAGKTRRVLGIPVGTYGPEGKYYVRRRYLGLQMGPYYQVNGATALAMLMAQHPDHRAFQDVMADGIAATADAFSGRGGTRLFAAYDVAIILATVLEPLPTAPPVDFRTTLDAATTLVQRYFEQNASQSADDVRCAFEKLLRELAPRVAHDVDHLGLCIGTVLAGTARFGADISTHDNIKRWRVAAVINMIWAASSFGPLFFVAGPWAVIDVGAGILWDRTHPVRDYSELLAHFEAELTQMLLNARLAWIPESELGRLFMRVRQCFRASGLPF